MRTKTYPSGPLFVIDVANIDVDYGGRIDWSVVPAAAPYLRPNGKKTVPAGTLMVKLDNGKRTPREVAPAGKTVAYITMNAIQEGAREDSHQAYAMYVGGQFWQNLLAPHHVADANFATWLGEFKTNSTGAKFEVYADSRVGA